MKRHRRLSAGLQTVSSPVTSMLRLGTKFHNALSERWELAFGINATHYSNGNTSWPNAGVNAIGALETSI